MASEAMSTAARDGQPSAITIGAQSIESLSDRTGVAHSAIMQTVRVIGGALIAMAVLTLVLTEVFSLDSMNVSSGPFASVYDALTTTGPAALSLLVIGLLVLAANRIMGFFGGGGF